jgi:hypothetical protein
VAASHTEPVTVAAEQGAIGFLVYLGVLASALAVLFGGLRDLMPGLRGPAPGGSAASGRAPPRYFAIARAAVAAAFVAMIVHSMTYAAFLTDPLTWALLALGIVLARGTAHATAPGDAASSSARDAPLQA